MVSTVFLSSFPILLPDPGLIFWTFLIFVIVYYILGRFAFRPIQNALKKREDDIQASLDQAKKAREEMANLKAENEELLRQAQEERAAILREAKETKDSIIAEARDKAKQEAQRIVTSAKEEIEHKRMEVLTSVKNELGLLALEVAEKLTRNELKGKKEQETLVNTLVDEIKFN
jgi:F-type H+-transporting ATPase subunit b